MGLLDNIIGYISPKAAYERARFAYMTQVINEHARKYDGAARGRRTSGWNPSSTSANQELELSLEFLRARSRDLVRNNPYAFRAIQGVANNVVGTGIKPAIVASSEGVKKQAKAVWDAWAGSTECDFDGMKNFYGLQKLIMRTVAESGECLVVRRRNRNKDVPFELQVLEPEYLDTTRNTTFVEGQPATIMGVEFDANGRRSAYWLYKKNPKDYYNERSFRVDASDVLHIYEVLRPGQVRGVPFGVSAFLRLKDFDDYEDAQLVRQKIAACFSVFVGDYNGDKSLLPGTSQNADGTLTERVEPGIIQHLPAGKTVTFASPPAAEGYEPYSRKILQGISVGYGTTYEMVTGDLSNVNFSSGRMGWIEFQRNVEDWQEQMLVPLLCDKVWKWFIEGAYLAGKIRTQNIAASWTPPRREMIDPSKETEALIEQVKAGLISWPEALRLMGYDPDMTMEEIAEWMKKVDTMGLKLSTDVRLNIKSEGDTIKES